MGDKKKEYRDKRTGMQTVRSAIFAIVLIIPGFWSDDTDIHMDYEVLRREFVIHGKDSLTLTNLGY